MPDSSRVACLALSIGALALSGGGCSGRTLVVVDPYACGDAGSPGCSTGLLNDLIGFWRLADGVGSTEVRDWSPWGNDGQLVGLDPSLAWLADGPEGVALAPDGKGYVNVLDSTSIDSVTDQVTVTAWVYLDGTIMNFATAISRQIGTGYGQHYHLSINAQQEAALYITTPALLTFVMGPTVPARTWTHLAGTYDGTTARLYVGGVEVSSGAAMGSFAPETNPVVLSGNGNGAGNVVSEVFPGRLADVMLYRRALSASEIGRLEAGALLRQKAMSDANGQ